MPDKEAGYIGIGPEEGIFVKEEEAYRYAINRCLKGSPAEQAEFKAMLEEWYFSGNWIKKEE